MNTDNRITKVGAAAGNCNSVIVTTSSQTIAKPTVMRRFDNAFTPPFRLGKKQKRAILDANGIEVIIMPHKNEIQAQMYCDYLNGA